MTPWENKAKAIWEHRITAWAFVFIALFCTCLFLWHSPSPGIAIAVLGCVAIVMSIRRLSSLQKVFWIAIVFVLLFVELTAIRVDRIEQIVIN